MYFSKIERGKVMEQILNIWIKEHEINPKEMAVQAELEFQFLECGYNTSHFILPLVFCLVTALWILRIPHHTTVSGILDLF